MTEENDAGSKIASTSVYEPDVPIAFAWVGRGEPPPRLPEKNHYPYEWS